MKSNLYVFSLLLIFTSCKNDVQVGTRSSVQTESETIQIPVKKVYRATKIGDTLDVFNDVYVFYNKSMNNTSGRHLAADGYNLGLKWQCVEFVKRYYYEQLNHKMPNTYGHAKDFFNPKVKDGSLNSDRNLTQFTNGSSSKPKVNDLLIFDGTIFNPYGHVAIISMVNVDNIEIVQQNVGKNSTDNISLEFKNNKWTIEQSDVLGWLRKE